LMSAFALPMAPASLTRHLHSPTERSSTTPGNPLITLAAKPWTHARRFRRLPRGEAFARTFLDFASKDPEEESPPGERNQVDCLRSAASVIGLSPVTSSAQDDSISELLRFL